jgi:hypothetical protein
MSALGSLLKLNLALNLFRDAYYAAEKAVLRCDESLEAFLAPSFRLEF